MNGPATTGNTTTQEHVFKRQLAPLHT